MAMCEFCDKEMTLYESCVKTTCRINGEDVDPLPVTDEQCHDCGVKKGGYHHSGCDMERCPACGGQIISCGCLDDEENEIP